MLGRTLCEAFKSDEVVVADLPECDITDRSSIAAFFAEADPDVVIHAAAMTSVDGCETDSALAYKINEEGTRNVAIVSAAMNARLIAVSTDYVFSGEPEEGRPDPWARGGSEHGMRCRRLRVKVRQPQALQDRL